jgi:protein-tyrosine phosphatase
METTRLDSIGREMHVLGMFNLRDLGGLPIEGGGTVRSGWLLRSGELSGLQPAGAAMLAELGLRTVVDLRTLNEIAARPDALDGTEATVHPIPLLALAYHEIPAAQPDRYAYMAEFCAAETARAVKALAAPDALPGLFHCAVGKDRTGVVAAVVLALIGVPDDEIIADFLRSNAALGLPRQPGVRSIAAEKVAEASPVYDMLLAARHAVRAEVMVDFLARVRARHGSAADYLRFGGVTDDELASLEAALVER